MNYVTATSHRQRNLFGIVVRGAGDADVQERIRIWIGYHRIAALKDFGQTEPGTLSVLCYELYALGSVGYDPE